MGQPSPEDRDDRSRRALGADRLARVQAARVLVVGAGALGNELVKHLALLGVRGLTVVDFDVVSASNLNRCVYFRPEHVGRPKVDALLEAVALQTHAVRIEDAPESVWQADLVALCVDDQMARYYVNSGLFAQGAGKTPVVNGAIGRNFFEVMVLRPGATACVVCPWSAAYHEQAFRRQARRSCDEFFAGSLAPFPAISVLPSLCAGVMAAEAIALLGGGEPAPSLGMMVRYEQEGHVTSVGRVHRNPRCVEVLCRTAFRPGRSMV